eukprot:3755061-Amphidinium_carterae.1
MVRVVVVSDTHCRHARSCFPFRLALQPQHPNWTIVRQDNTGRVVENRNIGSKMWRFGAVAWSNMAVAGTSV